MLKQVVQLINLYIPVLSALEESPDNKLHIKINVASIGEMEPEMLDGLAEPVVSVVGKCRPILPSSRVIDIRFENYILYQVRNESFSYIERKARQQESFLTTRERLLILRRNPLD